MPQLNITRRSGFLAGRLQAGFNLVEVLVAMVILSLGLLGIAGLQLMGVRANQGSYFRSQATSIMTDMAERMHNNLAGVNARAYASLTSTNACAVEPTLCAQENGQAAPLRCSPTQMAAYDFYSLVCGMRSTGTARVDRITDLLPGGRLTVSCINNATPPVPVVGVACQVGFRHLITVGWDERGPINAAKPGEQVIEPQTITLTFQP